MNTYSYNYLFKIVLVGDSGVGKTALVRRYADNVFDVEHMSTIGVDFAIKTVKIENELVKLQLWDTSGQQRFRTVLQHKVYRGSSAFIFVYDMKNPESLNSVKNWIEEVKGNSEYPESKFRYLVGNKQDLLDEDEDRHDRGSAFAKENDLIYITTSAKTGFHVDKLVNDLSVELVNSAKEKKPAQQYPQFECKEKTWKRHCCQIL